MANNSGIRWLRSVLAVLAGFFVIVVLSIAVDTLLEQTILPGLARAEATTGVWLFVTLYRIVISIGGCFVAAWLAPGRPMAHALALGVLGVFASTAGFVAMWGVGPMWYPLALILVALPCGWIGGKLYQMRKSAPA